MTATELATGLCKRFEGFYSRPYLCPAGVPTIGFGTIKYEDGTRVTLKDSPIDRARAEELLKWEIEKVCVPALMRLCPAVNTPERAGALMDFIYNLGSGALKSSTLRKRVNAGDWDSVPTELAKWVYGGGKRLRGLEIRRGAEAVLCE
jgi:lysozyme